MSDINDNDGSGCLLIIMLVFVISFALWLKEIDKDVKRLENRIEQLEKK